MEKPSSPRIVMLVSLERQALAEGRLQPMVTKAIQEFVRDDPRLETVTYTASNGIRITFDPETP